MKGIVLILMIMLLVLLSGSIVSISDRIMDQEKDPSNPSRSDIITISRDEVLVRGTPVTEVIKVGVFNPFDAEVRIEPEVVCDYSKRIKFLVNPKTIKPDSYRVFVIALVDIPEVPSDGIPCKVAVNIDNEIEEEDFFIKLYEWKKPGLFGFLESCSG